jgi:hypothetical protein
MIIHREHTIQKRSSGSRGSGGLYVYTPLTDTTSILKQHQDVKSSSGADCSALESGQGSVQGSDVVFSGDTKSIEMVSYYQQSPL